MISLKQYTDVITNRTTTCSCTCYIQWLCLLFPAYISGIGWWGWSRWSDMQMVLLTEERSNFRVMFSQYKSWKGYSSKPVRLVWILFLYIPCQHISENSKCIDLFFSIMVILTKTKAKLSSTLVMLVIICTKWKVNQYNKCTCWPTYSLDI